MAKFVRSAGFSFVSTLCIGLNALLIMYTTDFEMQSAGKQPSDAIVVAEVSFVLYYAIELICKLMAHRLYFFWGKRMAWNVFDMVLVGFSVVEASYLLTAASGNGTNISFLRILRFCKVAKVLRLFRALRFFADLRLLIDSVLASCMNLISCIGMMLFVLFTFALLIMQILAQTLVPENGMQSVDETDINEIKAHFGSVARTIITLLQSTTGGQDWETVYNLLEDRGWVLAFLFVFYILFWFIVAENVVTSAFVEKAFRLARPDDELLIFEQSLQDSADANTLRAIFQEADRDGSGGISLYEFETLISDPVFHGFLRTRGIDINNARLLYKMLRSCGDLGNEQDPDIKTFVNACLRMKGAASSVDMHSLSFEAKMVAQKQLSIARESQARLDNLEKMIKQLSATDL
eukprot:CAMPEP_0115383600 /NCGR_PEP_ID=MMETSP0271-20121206/6678_1 /TAXON_ID=71861 /ORGANISM="Scrippsiella trochoidea, Strain CCMP3099" /LENGTH=405 /DNA_ID=CAMNT_0002806933 /DNA_START=83 /DNA_END=1300 /DNA_ORIENTATION=+